MLSYSTLGSGAGPDVQKVADAVKIVKDLQPDLMVEGPIQYDAAIDPAVAKVKVKAASDVAGRANVFVFPDLNTGNNTYKAVQQATGAVAMGPVMQVRGGQWWRGGVGSVCARVRLTLVVLLQSCCWEAEVRASRAAQEPKLTENAHPPFTCPPSPAHTLFPPTHETQGLSKPVNDLSRGCTVADVVNTICVTSVQALGAKAAAKAAGGAAAAGGGAAAAGAGAKEPAAAATAAAAPAA